MFPLIFVPILSMFLRVIASIFIIHLLMKFVLVEGIVYISLLCRLFLRLYFADSDSNILCSSGSLEVFVINDVSDNLPVIPSLFVISNNIPVSISVSSPFIQYSSDSHSVFFTLDEMGIRHVLLLFVLESRYCQSSNRLSSLSLLLTKFLPSLAMCLYSCSISILLLLLSPHHSICPCIQPLEL